MSSLVAEDSIKRKQKERQPFERSCLVPASGLLPNTRTGVLSPRMCQLVSHVSHVSHTVLLYFCMCICVNMHVHT